MFIVIKDHKIPVKHLQLGVDDALICKWASSQYLSHMMSKIENMTPVSGTNRDLLYEASASNMYSNVGSGPARKEQGIKINVG